MNCKEHWKFPSLESASAAVPSTNPYSSAVRHLWSEAGSNFQMPKKMGGGERSSLLSIKSLLLKLLKLSHCSFDGVKQRVCVGGQGKREPKWQTVGRILVPDLEGVNKRKSLGKASGT